MTLKLTALIVLTSVLALNGCATKVYGRVNPLTEAEKASFTCQDIYTEIQKNFDFTNKVAKGSQFSSGDVVAAAIDNGIGNEWEKKAAIESAGQRLEQLKALSISKKCAPPKG
ncbi:MAG: hypothetical protein JWN94_4524 [Betaproteobacteria bacterium]|nr:hypothetical protein [Betaproteobacteria bacterium]